jgi:hypothetical protein
VNSGEDYCISAMNRRFEVAPVLETERLILRPHSVSAARTVCIIHRDNAVSLRLARKFGYETELRAATGEEPHLLLARDRAK